MNAPDGWWTTVGWLLGGLGLFLFGVQTLSDGVRQAAGSGLRRLIARSTGRPASGLVVGTVLTAVLQSSSALSVMLIGMVDAGVISLRESVGLLLGSGIGGTLTTQILLVNWIPAAALPMAGLGALLWLFGQRKGLRLAGQVVLGFGLVFLGFEFMKDGVAPWQNTVIRDWFVQFSQPGIRNRLLALLAGMAATVIVQSAAATTAIVVTLAGQGVLTDLPSALCLMIGCNIGTTITAVIAAIGASVTARRTAAVHVLFRFIGGLVSFAALGAYLRIIPLTASSLGQQLANFHTIHNTVNALLFLPLAAVMAWVASRLVSGDDTLSAAPQHLRFDRDSDLPERCQQAYAEIIRLAVISRRMIADTPHLFEREDDGMVRSLLQREKVMDSLHATITQFLFASQGATNTAQPSTGPVALLQVVHHIERVGDHAENLVELSELHHSGVARLDERLRADMAEAGLLLDAIAVAAVAALEATDREKGAAIGERIKEMENFCLQRLDHWRSRVVSGHCNPMSVALLEDVLANLTSAATHYRKAYGAFFGCPLGLVPD
jgi:phosphate:Na+ symporter